MANDGKFVMGNLEKAERNSNIITGSVFLGTLALSLWIACYSSGSFTPIDVILSVSAGVIASFFSNVIFWYGYD